MLTPIILAGVKFAQGVKYQQWDRHAEHLVHPQLWEAMHWVPPPITREELLECRERGLQVANQEKSVNPMHRWCLSHQQDGPLQDAPALAGTMLTQIWCAHPTLRNPLMVLDPQLWDHMPAPLLDHEVTKPQQRTHTQQQFPTKLPWLD
jgi:hypothetical protein